jgi:threonine dehydrogenase-like Zn-dependent dehydrogenase
VPDGAQPTIVTHRYPLMEAHAAFEVLENRIGDPVKIVLQP